MLRRGLMIAAMAGMLSAGAFAAEVYVNIAPPRVVVEHPGRAPHEGWVWRNGYHRWDGHAYVWERGEWIAPPRPHAHWVAARWVHRPGGWMLVEGHWR